MPYFPKNNSHQHTNAKVFGQTMKRKPQAKTISSYQKSFGGGSSTSRFISEHDESSPLSEAAQQAAARRRLRQEQGEAIDLRFGYHRLEDGHPITGGDNGPQTIQRRGWLFHMLATTVSASNERNHAHCADVLA